MRTLYLDCGSGVSGNMFLGGLIGLGFSLEYLKSELGKLAVNLPEITTKLVNKKGITATLFEVGPFQEYHHRHLSDIVDLISKAEIKVEIKDTVLRCFSFLAEAEAKIHGVSVEEIHFHEVGALDAIVDIVGTSIGMDYLKIESVISSPVRVGFGVTKCDHGEIPLPAPATVELLKGFYVFGGEYAGEWATPTGAALLKTFSSGNGTVPQMKVVQVGYGAGTTERPIPNVLRMILGETPPTPVEGEFQMMVETNIDDMNPELYGYLWDLLLKGGALDCYLTPVYMKKGRPGVLVSIITSPDQVLNIEKILMTETTTLGIRKYPVWRNCQERAQVIVKIDNYPVRVKTALDAGKIFKYAPEFEDCLKAAQSLNRPLKEIYDEVNYRMRNDTLFHKKEM